MISGDLIDGMLMFFLFQDGLTMFNRPYDKQFDGDHRVFETNHTRHITI